MTYETLAWNATISQHFARNLHITLVQIAYAAGCELNWKWNLNFHIMHSCIDKYSTKFPRKKENDSNNFVFLGSFPKNEMKIFHLRRVIGKINEILIWNKYFQLSKDIVENRKEDNHEWLVLIVMKCQFNIIRWIEKPDHFHFVSI